MANQLGMADVESIVSLARHGWSNRKIAKELGLDRSTVARYVRRAANAGDGWLAIDSESSKPAIAPLGNFSEELRSVSKPAIAPLGKSSTNSPICEESVVPRAGRRSDCEAYRETIAGKRDAGLTAQRIYQDLCEQGYAGSYYSVRRMVHKLGAARPEAFRRMECAPGEEVQVDFGTGAPVVDAQGKRRRPHVFRMVLSHSRKGYSQAVYRQTTEDFVTCLENAFWHFGGVPKTVVIDNLKAAVTRGDWYDPELHPILVSFACHYGTTILPTKPRTPRHKGKIERGIGYVKSNALKGRTFATLAAQNDHLSHWEANVADCRLHGTTKRHVGQQFVEIEKPALLPLPAERFPYFHEARRIVHRDGHIEVDKAYYSAPPEYVGQGLWVRWDARLVRLFNDRMTQVAVHAKHEPGKFSTDRRHLSDRKISTVERGAVALLHRIERIGPSASQWSQAMLKDRGIAGMRVLTGLISLGKRHPAAALEKACQIALSYGAFRLRVVRKLIDQDAQKQATMEFLQEHPIIRSLGDYGDLVRQSLHTET